MVIVSSSNILENFATRKDKTKSFETRAMERHRKWPCLITWPWISNPSSCSAAFVAQIPLVVAHCCERRYFCRGSNIQRKEIIFGERNVHLYTTLQTAEVVPILQFSPFREQRHFVGGQIIGKKVFLEKTPSLHCRLQKLLPSSTLSPCRERRHFCGGQIFGKVLFGEMSFSTLQAAEVVAILHIFPHHCPQFKSLFNPVRSWWIFFSLLCSVHNSKSYSCAWNFYVAPCIHQCKRAYIQFWCDPVPGYDPDMTLFSMGVVV